MTHNRLASGSRSTRPTIAVTKANDYIHGAWLFNSSLVALPARGGSDASVFTTTTNQPTCKAQFGPAQAGDVIYVTGTEVMYQLDSLALTTGVKNGARSRASFGFLLDDDVYG